MEEPRVLIRMTESELSLIVECLSLSFQKPQKRHYLPLYNLCEDLSSTLDALKHKAKKDRSEEPIINDGDSIIKEEENTTSEAQLFHGPLYCEKCD